MDALIPTRRNNMTLAANCSRGEDSCTHVPSDKVRAWLIFVSLLLVGYTSIPFDTGIAMLMHKHRTWDCWKIFHLSEIFSHAWGVGLIALGIASLAPWDAPKIPRLFCASLGAGLLANVGKLICARTRPHSFDLTLPSWESFQGLFPWWNGIYEKAENLSALQSVPSAHAATAAGLAWGLSRLYPQAQWYFVLLCVLAMGQRMVVEAHYFSDVCWGAALGIVWASMVFRDSRLGKRFDKVEARLVERWKIQPKIA